MAHVVDLEHNSLWEDELDYLHTEGFDIFNDVHIQVEKDAC